MDSVKLPSSFEMPVAHARAYALACLLVGSFDLVGRQVQKGSLPIHRGVDRREDPPRPASS